MKGIVFTEFVEFVETKFGLAMVDKIIDRCQLESGGAYTSVATYDVQELLALVGELSRQTDTSASELVVEYGRHLFRFFARTRRSMFAHFSHCEQLLESIEDQIHVDVRKLYPDAELPTIRFERLSDVMSKVHYSSTRPLADLAEGLILECVVHFGEPIEVVRTDLPPGDGTLAEFLLSRSR